MTCVYCGCTTFEPCPSCGSWHGVKREILSLRAEIAALKEELLKSHTALNLALNPRTPSDILLAVKYLEGLPPEDRP